MSKNKGRDLIVLDEFLTDKELDLSDFDGVDFKQQTTAIVELLTKNNPRLFNFEKLLTENNVHLSSEIWDKNVPVEDLVVEQFFTNDKAPDDRSLITEKVKFNFKWECETTEQIRLLENIIDDEFYKVMLGCYRFENIPEEYQSLKMPPEEFCFTNLAFKVSDEDKGKGEDKNKNKSNYIESIEKVIPPVDSSDDQYVTVTILVPSPHMLGAKNEDVDEEKKKVSKTAPEWTFHHTVFTNNQNLAMRLFVALECLGMSASGIGGNGHGVWTKLVSKLKLPVNSKISNKIKEGMKKYTLFQHEEKFLHPLFRGNPPNTVHFKSRSYTKVIVTKKNKDKSKTKTETFRCNLIRGFNELMMYTSGTAISIKVPVDEKCHQPPIIIAPQKWVDVLPDSVTVGNFNYDNYYYGDPIEPRRSYLFNEDYPHDSQWRRVHYDHRYFTPTEKKNGGGLGRG